jgi:hypothetical protein
MSLSSSFKKLFSGKYEFYAEGNQYAEESFEVMQHNESKSLWFRSYLHTRSSTGELLKIFIDYELTEGFGLKSIRIKKNAGKWTTEEEYIFDPKENLLKYKFKNPEGEHKEERAFIKRFFVQTPSVLCSAFFASNKKTESSARNAIVLLKSPNIINYEGPLEEYTAYVSYEAREGQTFNINQNNYQYIRCDLYSSDVGELENEFPIVIQVSKKFSLPFLVQFDHHHQARLVQLDTAASIDTNAL